MSSISHVDRAKLKALAELKEENIKTHGDTRKHEENVRLKIIVPLFEALGWNLDSDIDGEFPVRNSRVDLCLQIKQFPKLLIEVKDLNENLDNHVNQATSYIFDLESNVNHVILTNGNEFRYYRCDIIERSYIKLYEWTRSDLKDNVLQDKIISLISKEFWEEEVKQYRLDDLTLSIFLEKFNTWKIMLFKFLAKQIKEKFEEGGEFQEKIITWINYRPELSLKWTWKEETKNISMNSYFSEALTKALGEPVKVTKSKKTEFWKKYKEDLDFKAKIEDGLKNSGIVSNTFDKFALEATYLFLNRILFLRMAEDYGFLPEKILTASWIETFYKLSTDNAIYHHICSCLSEIDLHFPIIYQYPLFDNIQFEELRWSKAIVIKIIEDIILFDFSTSERDLIGKIYEKSIDKNTRKLLGQFYTDPVIVRFILSKLDDINENKRILDPACGSGTFLKEYYSIIKNHMLDNGYKEDDIPELLKSKIWGYDIDPFAVQLTSIKMIIEHFKKAPKERNIYNINSLKGELDEIYKKRLHIEKDVLNETFDYIVGNPPFFVVSSNEQPFKNILKTGIYDTIKDPNLNVASMFLYRYMLKLEQDGQIAFVFPRSLLHVNSFSLLRQELLKKSVQYIFDLGKAFEDVGLEQIIIIIKNLKPESNKIHYELLNFDHSTTTIETQIEYVIDQNYLLTVEENVFEVFSGIKNGESISGKQIKEKMLSNSNGNHIGIYCAKIQRGQGVQSSSTVNRKNSDDLVIIGGRSIFNFGKKGHNTYKYIPKNKIIKAKMSSKASRNLYSPKIMLQNIVSSKIRIVGCYNDTPIKTEVKFDMVANKKIKYRLYNLTFDTITNLFLKDEKYARFLLAILTSELIIYYLRDIVFVRQTLTVHLDEKYLKKIPVIEPERAQLERIDALVKNIENKVKDYQKNTPVSARSVPDWEDPNDARNSEYLNMVSELNDAIYELYGITLEEKQYIHAQLNEFDDYF